MEVAQPVWVCKWCFSEYQEKPKKCATCKLRRFSKFIPEKGIMVKNYMYEPPYLEWIIARIDFYFDAYWSFLLYKVRILFRRTK
ncbi:MAG: hypothetical protein ACREHC_01580 [Candidatus Levyibacteriota bacterium]